MKTDMSIWLERLGGDTRKKAVPVLSFPCVSLLGVTVRELTQSSSLQARGMKAVADRCDAGAALSMMDLSVEAEAFGSPIHISDDEVPTVTGAIVRTPEQAEALRVPEVGAARTGCYLEAIGMAAELITDRPVLAGVIGPYSLAGRLLGVEDSMADCYDDPDMVKTCLEKSTEFLIEYMRAYRKAGASGIVMAEPLTGLLSPALAEEFSEPYVRRIIDAVQDGSFPVIYHNCGNNTIRMIDSILRVGAAAYHFGDSISMAEMLGHIPAGTIVMGNVSPSKQFLSGTPESIRRETLDIMSACCPGFPSFVISSGCDIPPRSCWENIEAFFAAVDEYYDAKERGNIK